MFLIVLLFVSVDQYIYAALYFETGAQEGAVPLMEWGKQWN